MTPRLSAIVFLLALYSHALEGQRGPTADNTAYREALATVAAGNHDRLRALLSAPDALRPSGELEPTLVAAAAFVGDTTALQIVSPLAAGDRSVWDEALVWAAAGGSSDAVAWLIRANASVERADNLDGLIALVSATPVTSSRLAQRYLYARANLLDPKVTDDDHKSIAADLLLLLSPPEDAKPDTTLRLALVRRLANWGARPTAPGGAMFLFLPTMCGIGLPATCDEIAEEVGGAPWLPGSFDVPLAVAVEQGNFALAGALLSLGAPATVEGLSELVALAAVAGDAKATADILQALGTAGTLTTEQWNAILIPVVREGSLEAIRILLRDGATPDGIDREGTSALGAAVERGDPHIVLELIDRGARVVSSRSDPLTLAASRGNDQIVRLLVQRLGLDVNGRDPEWSPLHGVIEAVCRAAVSTDCLQPPQAASIIHYLLERGADVDRGRSGSHLLTLLGRSSRLTAEEPSVLGAIVRRVAQPAHLSRGLLDAVGYGSLPTADSILRRVSEIPVDTLDKALNEAVTRGIPLLFDALVRAGAPLDSVVANPIRRLGLLTAAQENEVFAERALFHLLFRENQVECGATRADCLAAAAVARPDAAPIPDWRITSAWPDFSVTSGVTDTDPRTFSEPVQRLMNVTAWGGASGPDERTVYISADYPSLPLIHPQNPRGRTVLNATLDLTACLPQATACMPGILVSVGQQATLPIAVTRPDFPVVTVQPGTSRWIDLLAGPATLTASTSGAEGVVRMDVTIRRYRLPPAEVPPTFDRLHERLASYLRIASHHLAALDPSGRIAEANGPSAYPWSDAFPSVSVDSVPLSIALGTHLRYARGISALLVANNYDVAVRQAYRNARTTLVDVESQAQRILPVLIAFAELEAGQIPELRQRITRLLNQPGLDSSTRLALRSLLQMAESNDATTTAIRSLLDTVRTDIVQRSDVARRRLEALAAECRQYPTASSSTPLCVQ